MCVWVETLELRKVKEAAMSCCGGVVSSGGKMRAECGQSAGRVRYKSLLSFRSFFSLFSSFSLHRLPRYVKTVDL